MNIIEILNLVHEYKEYDENETEVETVRAIDDVTLSIEEGSFVTIVGHNGSGKSTLAKHVNALLLPTGGTVLLCGQDTMKTEELWTLRKNAGMVFQNPDNQIIAGIVEEDVAFGPENLGVPTEELERRVEQALERVGMTAFRMNSPNHREEGITIVLITHYMEEAVDADRVIVMDGGKLVMDGTPREVFSRVEELKACRMTVPQVTELAHELRKEGVELPEGILTIDEFTEALWKLARAKIPE